MNTIKLFALVPAVFAAFLALPAAAQPVPEVGASGIHAFQLSLWSSVQTNGASDSIHGLRLNLLHGESLDVHGLDLGIANRTTRNLYGVDLGLGGYVGGDLRGVQSHLALSITRGNVMGLQEGIYTSAGSLSGVQFGVVNNVENASQGARFGAVNVSHTSTYGAEFGVVNYARRVRGLQLGLVNVTEELHGVQIGLANVAMNGFLPFFPVLNAAM